MNRAEALLFALMKSENPAASALARTYPGGRSAFISAMNAKAKSLGMNSTHYMESTGLHPGMWLQHVTWVFWSMLRLSMV